MSAHVCYLSQSTTNQNGKLISLPPLGFEPVIFVILAHLCDHSAKSHPQVNQLSLGVEQHLLSMAVKEEVPSFISQHLFHVNDQWLVFLPLGWFAATEAREARHVVFFTWGLNL
jgi:hypothetical protein